MTEPGSNVADAQSLGFDELAAGRIDSSTDADYFKINVPAARHVFLRAVSNTVAIDGAVVNVDDAEVAANVFQQTFTTDGPMGFTVSARLAAGDHYLKVTRSGGDSTGGYALTVKTDLEMDSVVSKCSALSTSFSDPLFGCQWHLRNRAQIGGVSGQDIHVEDVWSGGNMGAGIAVAVVDGGVHAGHPDLTDNVDVARSHDYTPDGLQFVTWIVHGTAVAGIVAARDNALGMRGVAPRATIYGYNLVLNNTDENQADAMTRNLQTTGVSNNSWGFTDGPELDPAEAAWEMAVDTGVTTGYDGKGIVYVWAAGNGHQAADDSNFDGRANYYATAAVCSVNNRGTKSHYSEKGANLWVCAPSNDYRDDAIYTTVNYGRYTGGFGGTSAASPIVAGVAALLRSASPSLTWRDVKLILAGSARKNHSSHSDWVTGAPKYGASGNYNFNHSYGFGVVDAKAAVDLAATWEPLPPMMDTGHVDVVPMGLFPDLGYVPDGTGSGAGVPHTSTVTIGTEVEFIEFVELKATFDGPSNTISAFRDLLVELVSPSNTNSVLAVPARSVNVEIEPEYRFGSARHLGENPAGTWTLRLTDHYPGGATELDTWSLKIYGHRSTPGPPSISLVDGGRRSLTATWSEPTVIGTSAISSYHVRTIRSDATNKADERWLVHENAWATGALSYEVASLLDSTEYDVQVRGVNTKGAGVWSETVTATTLPNQAPLSAGSLTGPTLQVGDGNEVVEVADAFEDPENDALTYGASSSAPGVAGAAVSGSRVTLTPLAHGTATITVTATDVTGSNTQASQRFDVRVKARRGVTVSTAALTVTEGSSETYTVVLNAEPTGDVVVTAAVPANTDVTVDPPALTFTIGDWQTPQSVVVEAEEDMDSSADPVVPITHQVSGSDYGSVRASSLRVTIVETGTSTLSVTAAEAAESSSSIIFEVTLSRPSNSEITVDYATSNGPGSADARAGSDYTAASGTLTFPANSTAFQEIVVEITDDTEDEEEEETFRLTLGNPQNAELAGGGSTLQVTGTIRDDDDPEVEVSFGSSSYGVAEGRTVDVVVRLNRDPERDLEIFLEETLHGGAADADYSGVPLSVAFGPGVKSQQFQVAATDDTMDDDGEAVVLSFVSLPPRVSDGGETTIAITDNDGSGGGGGGPPAGGGGGPPPGGDDPPPGDDDDGGGVQPPPPPAPGGPPKADFTLTAECAGDLCRARTGLPVTFEDTSTGRVQSRRWDFGDGTGSRNRRVDQVWAEPGFYEVSLTVSDGTTESIASEVFLVEAGDPAGTCESSAERRCLQDSRYAVTVDWQTAAGSGRGRVVHAGTNDSGLFTFFDRNNWEVLIKVLDGCALNGHVWVFGASTTDLGYVIRVTDTVTGTVKEYRNEPGMPASAVTDVSAFEQGCRPN